METLHSESEISNTGTESIEGDAWLSIDLVSWQVNSSVTWDADGTLFDPQFYVCIDIDGDTDGTSPECVWTKIWNDKIELNNSWNITFDLPEDFEFINITIECWDNDESSDEWNDGNDACDLNADNDYWRMYYQTNFSDFTSENVTGSGYGDQNSQGSKGDASSIWNFSLIIYPDSDSDGVADQFDDCNQTPEGREISTDGCWWMEGDIDGDGIINPEDRCTGKFGGCELGPQYIIQDNLLHGVSWFHTNGEIMTLIDTDLDNSGWQDFQVVNENGVLTNFTAGVRGVWQFGGMTHQEMKGYSPNGDYLFHFRADSGPQLPCIFDLHLVNNSTYHERLTVTNFGSTPCDAVVFAQEKLYVWLNNGELIYYEHEDLDSFVKGESQMTPTRNYLLTLEDYNSGGVDVNINPSGSKVVFRYGTSQGWETSILDTESNSVNSLPISIEGWEDRTGFISDRHFFDSNYYFDILTGSTTEFDLPDQSYSHRGNYPILSYSEGNGDYQLTNPISGIESTVIGCSDSNACGSSGGIFLVSPDGKRVLFGGLSFESEWNGVPYAVGYIDSDIDGIPDINDMCSETDVGLDVNENGCAGNQKDDDSDGVLNSIDNCSNTVSNLPVDDVGCAQYQLDDDIDGVANDIDTCPNTPGGETVNLSGCSASQVDNDGDGVYDSQDNCPSTPSETTVDSTGCAPDDVVDLDSDEDGIRDSVDDCPNSAAGIIVDSTGCETSGDVQEVEDEVSSDDSSDALYVGIGLLVFAVVAVVGIRSLNSSNSDSYNWDYDSYNSISNQTISTPEAEPNLDLQNVIAELERQRAQSEREIRQMKQQQAQQASASEIAAMQREMQALQQRVADAEQAKLQLQNEIEQVKTQKDESIKMQDSVVGGDMVASGGQKIESQTNVMGTDPEAIARIIFEAQEKERERLRREHN